MHSRSPWKTFHYALESFERELKALQFPGAFQPPVWPDNVLNRPPENTLSLWQVDSLLNASCLAPPHGIDSLTTPALPEFPKFPERPNSKPAQWENWYVEMADSLAKQARELHTRFQDQQSAVGGVTRAYETRRISASTTFLAFFFDLPRRK